jgi:hypothetical protein
LARSPLIPNTTRTSAGWASAGGWWVVAIDI